MLHSVYVRRDIDRLDIAVDISTAPGVADHEMCRWGVVDLEEGRWRDMPGQAQPAHEPMVTNSQGRGHRVVGEPPGKQHLGGRGFEFGQAARDRPVPRARVCASSGSSKAARSATVRRLSTTSRSVVVARCRRGPRVRRWRATRWWPGRATRTPRSPASPLLGAVVARRAPRAWRRGARAGGRADYSSP